MHLTARLAVFWIVMAPSPTGCSPSGSSPKAMVRAVSDPDRAAVDRNLALVAALRTELRYLTRLQQAHFSDHHTYAGSLSQLNGYQPETGVTVTALAGTSKGWSASVTHASLPGATCSVYVGSPAPPPPPGSSTPPSEGEPYCSPVAEAPRLP
jgi:hypothetical protein